MQRVPLGILGFAAIIVSITIKIGGQSYSFLSR